MTAFLCLLLVTIANDEPAPAAVEAVAQEADIEEGVEDEVEEEVDFDNEEDVDFGEQQVVARVSLPDVDYRPWLFGLPIVLIGLLAWNVAWRRPPKTRPRRSAIRD